MKTRFVRLIAVCIWIVSIASAVLADGADVRKAFEKHLAENGIVGGSVAIVKDGNVLFAEGFGWQDRDARIKATGNTVYRLASISKPVTTIAAMQLVESGKMSLFAHAQRYAPAFPKKEYTFTLRHLLTHTSGIRHYVALRNDNSSRRIDKTSDAIEKFADDDLLFEPGTRYRYSTHAFTLVALMIEGASGMTFEEYLKKNVFELPSRGTLRLEKREIENKQRSQLYQKDRSGVGQIPTTVEDNSWKYAGGGMESSPIDLARFGDAVLHNELLKKETVDFMWSPQSFGEFDSGRGLGWELTAEGNPVHSGSQQGSRTFLYVDRETDFVYCVMTNTSGHDVGALMIAVIEAWERQPRW